ncbi:hypothetical protein N665_0090s0014 [Sinapis alba]|nr:hypothetical protein N665_0090s0014 [Sinapis alba]
MLNRDDLKAKEDGSSSVGGEEMAMVTFSEEVTGDDVVNPSTIKKSVNPGTEQSPRYADEREEISSEKEEEEESKEESGEVEEDKEGEEEKEAGEEEKEPKEGDEVDPRRNDKEAEEETTQSVRQHELEHETESHAVVSNY